MTKKVKGRLTSDIGDEFGVVDPRRFGTLIPGAMHTADKLNGDELTLPPNTVLTVSGDRRQGRPRAADFILTVTEVDSLLARAREVRLLFIQQTGWRSPVYDLGGDNVTKAWRRLRPMYLLEDGYPPYGYAATALIARLWLGDGTTTLVFEVRC